MIDRQQGQYGKRKTGDKKRAKKNPLRERVKSIS
jgi:hypothetical protein